jgi:hypothetical protein
MKHYHGLHQIDQYYLNPGDSGVWCLYIRVVSTTSIFTISMRIRNTFVCLLQQFSDWHTQLACTQSISFQYGFSSCNHTFLCYVVCRRSHLDIQLFMISSSVVIIQYTLCCTCGNIQAINLTPLGYWTMHIMLCSICG